MNHNRNVKSGMEYQKKKKKRRRGICILVVTAGLYDEQTLEGPRCRKSEYLNAKGVRRSSLRCSVWCIQLGAV